MRRCWMMTVLLRMYNFTEPIVKHLFISSIFDCIMFLACTWNFFHVSSDVFWCVLNNVSHMQHCHIISVCPFIVCPNHTTESAEEKSAPHSTSTGSCFLCLCVFVYLCACVLMNVVLLHEYVCTVSEVHVPPLSLPHPQGVQSRETSWAATITHAAFWTAAVRVYHGACMPVHTHTHMYISLCK